jgi:hypothetical protein
VPIGRVTDMDNYLTIVETALLVLGLLDLYRRYF